MASSATAPKTTSRRFQWLAAGIVAVVALYTVGWFVFAGFLEDRAAAALAGASRNGTIAECADLRAHGYPFRLGLFCDSIRFENALDGSAFSAGAFRSAAQVYDPGKLVGELDGPATLTAPGLPPLKISWEALRASTRLARPLPSRLSIEGRALSVASGPAGEALMDVQSFEAHVRTRDADADVAARFAGLAIAPALTQGRTLPPLSGEADAVIADGVAFLASPKRSLRGRSGEIRNLVVTAGADAGLTVSGPLSVGEDGLVDAALSVKLRNPAALGALLGGVMPEAKEQIETAFSGVAALAGGGGETPALPLRIERGEVSVGFIRVGRIPAVD